MAKQLRIGKPGPELRMLIGVDRDGLAGLFGRRHPRNRHTELRLGLSLALEEPVTQSQRRDAVLLVIAFDGVEDGGVPRAHPAVELDHRLARVGDVPLPRVGHEERADLFQPVAVV